MSKIKIGILILLFAIAINLNAQIERETRAVWLTTNHRLDWPPPIYNSEKQKNALIEILDNIKAKNLNTVYFQVRSNGTVLFQSSFEPLSPYITGEVDGSADYDPLKFAIEQAHKRGLEIHAWLNMINVFSSSEEKILSNPNHIYKRKPEWVIEDFRDGVKTYWLDAGLPEVRDFLSDMILEMVENYNVDGVHLDYLRYPGKNFDDDFSFNVYGKGLLKDDWRRANLDQLVEDINKKIKLVRPNVKLGAAPIGIYKRVKGMAGWESYYELYQDSYGWLNKGIIDYVAPQIYWGIEENPSFTIVAKDWKQNSAGKNVVLGIAAYKDNVKKEIEEQIKISRDIKSSGIAFFRYEHIKDYYFSSFNYKSFPSAMPWLDGVFPEAPKNLALKVTDSEKNIFSLQWQVQKPKSGADSISYYAIYKLPTPTSQPKTEYLFEVVSAPRTILTLAVDKPKKRFYYFSIKSVNKVWNESREIPEVVTFEIPAIKNIYEKCAEDFKPALVKNSSGFINILLYSYGKEKIEVLGKALNKEQILYSSITMPGKNILTIKENLANYTQLKIKFLSSKKEVELKL